MADKPLRVASLGMGWWSDVLADAMQRSKKFEIAACYTRSEEKRNAFARKYNCRAVPGYDAILKDGSPSCGSGFIYDGSFSGGRKADVGVTAALLERNGIRVFSETRLEEAEAYLQDLEGIGGGA